MVPTSGTTTNPSSIKPLHHFPKLFDVKQKTAASRLGATKNELKLIKKGH